MQCIDRSRGAQKLDKTSFLLIFSLFSPSFGNSSSNFGSEFDGLNSESKPGK